MISNKERRELNRKRDAEIVLARAAGKTYREFGQRQQQSDKLGAQQMTETEKELLIRIEAKLDAILAMMRTPRMAQPPRLVAGRWPLRDGDTYGIIAAQPKVETSPEPPVHGHDTTGDL